MKYAVPPALPSSGAPGFEDAPAAGFAPPRTGWRVDLSLGLEALDDDDLASFPASFAPPAPASLPEPAAAVTS